MPFYSYKFLKGYDRYNFKLKRREDNTLEEGSDGESRRENSSYSGSSGSF